jgi:fructose-bisphosphate aldolase class I
MNYSSLEAVAQAMVAKGKGILAADESFPTIKKRFDSIQVSSTEATRNAYRDLLFTTDGMEQFISGVIMFDETIRQATLKDGIPFPEYLSDRGVIPGIKVDKGAKPLAGFPGEKVTEGLDGLRDRLQEYYQLGARFAKWRAVITIGEGIPSRTCLEVNAHALARYAALCQENNLVPIVEPEVLMNGDHSIERSFAVTEETLHVVFDALYRQGVVFEQMVLKPNMVLSGYDCPEQATVEEVAELTIKVLKRTVPAAVPGIAFLSGGQSDQLATEHLNAMNRILGDRGPWNLTYSYGRALQQPALKAWAGRGDQVAAAQQAFYHRARCNGAATRGEYTPAMEQEG